MLNLLKNKKIIYSFFLWLLSIGLFDTIFFLKKDNESITNVELLFLAITVILGIIAFSVFILTLKEILCKKYSSIKGNIFSFLLYVFFLFFGLAILISPFIISEGFKKQKQLPKPNQTSKNTLISSGLKLGSFGDEVKVLQSALSTDKSIYPSSVVSGYFGELTKQAVINFQKKYNLPITGEIDQQTADKFNEVYGEKTKEYYLTLFPTPIKILQAEKILIRKTLMIMKNGEWLNKYLKKLGE